MRKYYNGEVELLFNKQLHKYTLDGVVIPNVTSVTGVVDKPALVPWAVNATLDFIAEQWQSNKVYTANQIRGILNLAKTSRYRISEKALNIGSVVHDWIELYIKSKMVDGVPPALPIHPMAKSSVEAFLVWDDAYSVKYLESEIKILSLQHMYAGTADIIAEVGNKCVGIDIKTSKGIYPEYFVQVAAYAKAHTEEFGTEFDEVAILRVDKETGAPEYSSTERIDELHDVFLACLKIWRWANEFPEPKSD